MSNEKSPDAVRDMTKVGRLLKRVATGEMTLGDLLFGGIGRGDPVRCSVTAQCVLSDGHEGGCCIDATVPEGSEP